jgi:hypothetical protein
MVDVRTLALFAVLGPVAACSNDSKSAPAPGGNAATGTVTLQGVYPDDFQCDSVAPPAQLAEVLGATPRVIEGTIQTPRGVPRPCNYLVGGDTPPPGDASAPGPEAWTFDIDCRDGYDVIAGKLFDQYARGSQDLVDQYNAVVDAGHLEIVDGGPPIKAPEAAHEVQVGKRALDHHGQGLLFIDDDAPCYVRVIGPDAARRLALAKLIAQNLTPARAPMTPRAATK